MPKAAGQLVINVSAGTAQAVLDMERLNQKFTDFGRISGAAGHTAVSQFQATAAGLRLIEGGFGNSLRAAERFLASIPAIGRAAQAIFPVVGAIAFGAILVKVSEEAKKMWDDIENGGKKAAQAFRGVGDSLRSSNDELRVQNAQLDIEIAKLQGKRENTLALWLAEAQKAADSLSESLEKVVEQFSKVAKEQQVSVLRQFAGEAGTSSVTKMAQEDLIKLERLNDEHLIKVNDALRSGNKAAVQAAQDEWTKALQGYWETQRKYALKMLKDAEDLAKGTPAHEVVVNRLSGATAFGGYVAPKDTTQLQDEIKAYISRVVDPSLAHAELVPEVDKKKGIVADLQAGRAAQKIEAPYENKMAELKAQLEGINKEIDAIGKGPAAEAIAASMAEADKQITEVNKRLKELGPTLKLTADQEKALTEQERTIGERSGVKEWEKQLESANVAVNERIRSETMLADAIGKGFAATRQAAIETEVLSKVTAKYYDATNLSAEQLAEIERYRAAATLDVDAKHATQVATAIKGLNEQVALEKALSRIEQDGAEAVRRVTLEYRLLDMARNGASKEQIQLERELANLQHQNQQAAATAKLNTQIQGQFGVLAAIPKGPEAAREAEIEAHILEMKQEGASEDEQKTYRAKEYLALVTQTMQEAYKGIYATEGQIEAINRQVEMLRLMQGLGDKSIETQVRLKELENDRLKLAEQEALELGNQKDAVVAFFLEMEQQANNAGQIMAKSLFDAMNSALDKVSDNFTKLITGQKTEWGKAFKDIGDNLLKTTVKTGLEKGLAAVGEHIPAVKNILDQLHQGDKPDFTKSKPGHVIVDNLSGAPSTQQGTGTPGSPTSGPGSPTFGNGGILGTRQVPTLGGGSGGAAAQSGGGFLAILKKLLGGGIFGKGAGGAAGSSGAGGISDFLDLGGDAGGAAAGAEDVSSSISFTGMATGGDVTPGQIYMTGEHGPEPFVAGMSGHIMSNAAARQAFGGGGATYNIDARGSTDPYLTTQHVENALKAYHNSSISMSVRANNEREARTPSKAA